MDKMAVFNDNLVKAASAYIGDGCSVKETKELLSIDGYEQEIVDHYFSKRASKADGIMWGFDVEDSYGKILTSEDLGIEICASDEKQAFARAEEMVKLAGCDSDFEKIIGVYPIAS